MTAKDLKFGEEAEAAYQSFLAHVGRLYRQAEDQHPGEVDEDQSGNAESTVTDYDTKADQAPMWSEDYDGEDDTGSQVGSGQHPEMPGASGSDVDPESFDQLSARRKAHATEAEAKPPWMPRSGDRVRVKHPSKTNWDGADRGEVVGRDETAAGFFIVQFDYGTVSGISRDNMKKVSLQEGAGERRTKRLIEAGSGRRLPKGDGADVPTTTGHKVAGEMVRDSEHAVLEVEFQEAFAALRNAGLEADADDPIAERYRAASDAVNHANRSRDFAILTGQPTAGRKTARDFDSWMEAVDAAVQKKVGMSVHDLSDIDFRGLFDAGESPSVVARKALANDGYSGSRKTHNKGLANVFSIASKQAGAYDDSRWQFMDAQGTGMGWFSDEGKAEFFDEPGYAGGSWREISDDERASMNAWYAEQASAQASRKTAEKTEILDIKRKNGVAGEFVYTAEVQYEGEDPMFVSFYGSAFDSPIVMEMNGNRESQTFVTDPTRFGPKLDKSWVRNFFTTATKKTAMFLINGVEFVHGLAQEDGVCLVGGEAIDAGQEVYVSAYTGGESDDYYADRSMVCRWHGLDELRAKEGSQISKWELKLNDGSIVSWSGETGEDAARRYVDTFRQAVVIATRPAEQWGFFPGVRAEDIREASLQKDVVIDPFPWEKTAAMTTEDTLEDIETVDLEGDDIVGGAFDFEETKIAVEGGNLDGFWEAIDTQIEQLHGARSADDVIRILPVVPGLSVGDGWFGGGGGDQTVWGALREAGWKTIWFDAPYYFAMEAPDGSGITYVEGDIYKGVQAKYVEGEVG